MQWVESSSTSMDSSPGCSTSGRGWLGWREVSKQTFRWQPTPQSMRTRGGKRAAWLPHPIPYIHNHGLTCMHIARITTYVAARARSTTCDFRQQDAIKVGYTTSQRAYGNKLDRPIGYCHVVKMYVGGFSERVSSAADPIETYTNLRSSCKTPPHTHTHLPETGKHQQ